MRHAESIRLSIIQAILEGTRGVPRTVDVITAAIQLEDYVVNGASDGPDYSPQDGKLEQLSQIHQAGSAHGGRSPI